MELELCSVLWGQRIDWHFTTSDHLKFCEALASNRYRITSLETVEAPIQIKLFHEVYGEYKDQIDLSSEKPYGK